MSQSDAPKPSFMDDVRSTLEALAKEPMNGNGLTYCAMELLGRWNAEAPQSEKPAIPEGMVLVPRKPTEEMLIAMRADNGWQALENYSAMLAAAPSQPVGEEKQR